MGTKAEAVRASGLQDPLLMPAGGGRESRGGLPSPIPRKPMA